MVAERAAVGPADSEGFWLDRVSDRPDCRLPRWPGGRAAGPEHGHPEHGHAETLLPAELCDRIAALARRCDVPVTSVVLAAHLRVVSLVTGSPDLLVGLTRGPDLDTVPLLARLAEGSWLDLINAASDAEREPLPHRCYPLGALRRKLGRPLTEVNLGCVPEQAGFPLNVNVSARESGRMLLAIDYRADVLAQEQVLLMRGYYLTVFEAMTADPLAAHHLAPLLGDAERALVASWNDTGAEVPPVAVHELVRARAAESPDAVAVVSGPGALTYGELDARADQLAWRLRGLGVGPDIAVGLCLERSLEMVVGLLAILKAGGVYVPLDAAFPADRLSYMLSQVSAPVVLAHDSTAGRLRPARGRSSTSMPSRPPPRPPARPPPCPSWPRLTTRATSSSPRVPRASPRASSPGTATSPSCCTAATASR